MFSTRTWAVALTAGAAALVLATPGTAWAIAYDPTGTEPPAPYPMPANAAVPVRGCQTIAAAPAAPPPSSIPALQVIYAWHDGEEGDRYEASVEEIAKVVDRIDWALDNSTNYDQHINLSCRYTPNGTYGDYARALVAKEKIEAAAGLTFTDSGVTRADLMATGYTDPNRYYLVFTDYHGSSDAFLCPTTGGVNAQGGQCSAIAEVWDTGVAGHELVHVFGAGHTFVTEVFDTAYYWDIMYGWWDNWQFDQDFNHYYDPSEPSATFYIDPYPSTVKDNIADHPALTVPTCCDVGYNNDLLTAQERTIEANTPGSTPTGFSFSGSGSRQVTPIGSIAGVSARYYDGRRSMTVTVNNSGSDAVLSVTRRPAVTTGTRYRFFSRLTTNTAGTVKLRLTWFNSSGSQLSSTDSALIALDPTWREYSVSGVAPSGAATVRVSVVAPPGQSFAYLLDSLQLNACTNGVTSDGCRLTP
jgi:hypothetical protein